MRVVDKWRISWHLGARDFVVFVLVDADFFHLGLAVFITSQGCATNGS
jgi:hypothetical protein